MNGPDDLGCANYWCMDLRVRLAYRADTAEKAVRGLTHEVRALRGEISRLKATPEDQAAEKYVEFKGRAWILLGLILMVAGGALIAAVLIPEHIMSTTTFYEGP